MKYMQGLILIFGYLNIQVLNMETIVILWKEIVQYELNCINIELYNKT